MKNKNTAQKIKEKYNATAKNWNKVWTKSENLNSKIIKFINNSNPDAKFLSVGIGKGDLERRLKYKNISGVDISKEMIKMCKANNPNFKLLVRNAEKLPYKDNSFDIVFARNYLRNFVNPTKAFKEMYRVLKVGGQLVIIESAVRNKDEKYVTKIIRCIDPFRPKFPTHENIKKLFVKFKLKKIKQQVERLHTKWLKQFCKSKNATKEQAAKIIKISENVPEWNKKYYRQKVYKDLGEIESTTTFTFIKGIK